MSDRLEELKKELIKECPVCCAMLLSTATAEDGLSDGRVFEAVYNCGGRVQIDDCDELHVTNGCPRELRDACDKIVESVEEMLMDVDYD